jgi:hypothetical protein
MFMIFSLHKLDLLPINNLNVRKDVQLLYNLGELPQQSQMDQLCKKWQQPVCCIVVHVQAWGSKGQQMGVRRERRGGSDLDSRVSK